MLTWTVLIPVKPADTGKSRLGQGRGTSPGTRPALARAIALDTIAAAVGSGARVLVVTADTDIAADASGLGAEVVLEPHTAGLAAAIATGFGGVELDVPRAILLGDLPYLHPEHLRDALARAAGHDRAFVADAEGTGSTLVTAASGIAIISAFGADSARKHRDAGLVDLDLPVDSALRRDVDLDEHLTRDGLGPRTRAALQRVE